MKNRLILDGVPQYRRSRLAFILASVPIDVVETKEGGKIFPHLEVKKRKGPLTSYDFVPLSSGNYKFEASGSLPKTIRAGPPSFPDFFIYDYVYDPSVRNRRVSYKFGIVQRDALVTLRH